MRRRKTSPPEEPFQMAPMIDMVFLLLVFFMTVSTLARDSRPELELAVSRTATVPEETPLRDVLSVIPDGDGFRYYWGHRLVQAGRLQGLLEASGEREGSPQLVLRGGPDLPWSAWTGLLQMIRDAGLQDLVLATFED